MKKPRRCAHPEWEWVTYLMSHIYGERCVQWRCVRCGEIDTTLERR